jgi:hypothetical protein
LIRVPPYWGTSLLVVVGTVEVVGDLEVVVWDGVVVAGSPPQDMRIKVAVMRMIISPNIYLFTRTSSI